MAGAFQGNAFQNDAFQVDATSLTLDAVLKRTTSASFTLDAQLKFLGSTSFTLNSVLKKIRSSTFTFDAVIDTTIPTARVSQLAIEAILVNGIRHARVSQIAIESVVATNTQHARVSQIAIEVLLNAVLNLSSFTFDAWFKKTRTGSFTFDALVGVVTKNFLLQSHLRRIEARTFTLNATLTGTDRTNGTIPLNAVIFGTSTNDFVLRAWIKKGTTGVTGESGVHIKIDGVDITDDVIFEDATFTMLVNGAPGSFSFRVRDNNRTRDFTSGAEVTLDIEGIRKFGGYLMSPARVFAFPVDDTSDVSRVTRFWKMTGVDYNILFTKRIVYDKADPTNVNLRSWPAGSQDDVIIKYVFDHYTDLRADGATYDGVTHVGSPNPDASGVVASGSHRFGDAMREINRLISAVWYFDPYKDLHFVDVDTADAEFSLTDRPSAVGEIGYRAFTHTENGSKLVNDAMVWGAGTGSAGTVTYARVQDAASQAAHGLWQFGEFTSQLYKQASVNKRADSVVNGTPQSRRGGKDDQVSWTVTTYDTSFSVGQKVQIESEVFGVSDVVPIRRMTITFPTKDNPKLDLILSHEIDEPWNLYEFYFPRINLPPIPPIEIHTPTPFVCIRNDFNLFNNLSLPGLFVVAGFDNGDPGNNARSGLNSPPTYIHVYAGCVYRLFYSAYWGPTTNLLAVGMPQYPSGANSLGSITLGSPGTGETHFASYTIAVGAEFDADLSVAQTNGTIANSVIGSEASVTVSWVSGPDPRFFNLPICQNGMPAPGQEVLSDLPTGVPIDSTTWLFTTLTAYNPGTLRVFRDGVETTLFVESNPAAGQFTMLANDAIGFTITATYVSAGTAETSDTGSARDDIAGSAGTLVQLAAAYIPGSTRVFFDGYFQRPGIEYTESDPAAGQITTAGSTLGKVISVFYEVSGLL